MLEPKKGIVTFRAEGNNIKNSPYYSRVIHWPESVKTCSSLNERSGVTIGRGYDMRHRTRDAIIRDLRTAGVPLEQANKISLGSKLHNCNAASFVLKNRNEIGEITEDQQIRLFNLTYPKYEIDAKRFYEKYRRINSPLWDELNIKLRDIFVDMKYQGVLHKVHVLTFEKNSANEVIELIESRQEIRQYENGRNRVKYLKGES
ncbi:hypothetical protein [Rosenbergiella epipactidis]|uniref:hypothetical protein n=1 Tax=Rosenbergiella epipactidis TaxID=1544694 RepID=UPI001F5022A9|nr:hypothetical protein [Rosenbergiella epipactidis]